MMICGINIIKNTKNRREVNNWNFPKEELKMSSTLQLMKQLQNRSNLQLIWKKYFAILTKIY